MTQHQADFLKECAEFSGNDAEVRNYSGRGMMGRETVGIVIDHPVQLLNDVLQYVADNMENGKYVGLSIPNDFDSFRIDNMANQTILY
jgi:hypothetical protein